MKHLLPDDTIVWQSAGWALVVDSSLCIVLVTLTGRTTITDARTMSEALNQAVHVRDHLEKASQS